jgi:hypothetical protein
MEAGRMFMHGLRFIIYMHHGYIYIYIYILLYTTVVWYNIMFNGMYIFVVCMHNIEIGSRGWVHHAWAESVGF